MIDLCVFFEKVMLLKLSWAVKEPLPPRQLT
jgi:hypothetical protein